MLWLSHTHAASATVGAARLDHWLVDGPCLCVAQHAALAFYALTATPGGAAPLTLVERVPLRARVLALEAVRGRDGADRVLLLTDHPVPRLIVLRRARADDVRDDARPNPCPGVHTETSFVLSDPTRPPAELGLGLYAEPAGGHEAPGARWVAAHTHTGQLRVVPLGGAASPAEPARAFNAPYVVCADAAYPMSRFWMRHSLRRVCPARTR